MTMSMGVSRGVNRRGGGGMCGNRLAEGGAD